MQPKKNLNNTQRKMLEKIYTVRLDKHIAEYSKQRAQERVKLAQFYLDEAAKTYASLLQAGAIYANLLSTNEEKLKADGLSVMGQISAVPKLEFRRSYGYASGDGTPPVITSFDNATREGIDELNSLRDEITLRIYGADTTYDEIDKDINALITKGAK